MAQGCLGRFSYTVSLSTWPFSRRIARIFHMAAGLQEEQMEAVRPLEGHMTSLLLHISDQRKMWGQLRSKRKRSYGP